MSSPPPLDVPRDGPSPDVRPDKDPAQLTIEEFRRCFLHGSITPWDHNQYLRAAYITLLEPDNQERGLLDVATKFAGRVNSFNQRNSEVQREPESRTLTVFWLYHIRLAMKVTRAYQMNYDEYYNFKRLLHYIPEMVDEDLATAYYSPDILESEYSKKFWILPNLRQLIEPIEYPDLSFRERFIKKDPEDPERLLRFAFDVVRRYLRPGETRRRSWFINLAFAALQQQTIRLRSMRPQVSPYSETQSYFYLQLVHAALSQLLVTGDAQLIQDLSYPQFQDTFHILPSAWDTYYSAPLWDSLKSRASFVPPDLRPLPDTIQPPEVWTGSPDRNARARFHHLGLIPELPSLETLHFHQAILLETAKALPTTTTTTTTTTIPPSAVTTHAHLLKYIHTHLILPPLPADNNPPPTLLTHHRHLLTTHSLLPKKHITYYLSILRTLQPPYTPPPPVRYHNCPCHANVPIPWGFSPDAVDASRVHEQRQRQQRVFHGCACHGGPVVGDVGADVDGGGQGKVEEEAGVGADEGENGDVGWQRGVGWEEWVRGEGGLVFCWDEAWKGVGGRVGGEDEGKEGRGGGEEEGEVDADEKTLRGEEGEKEGKEGKSEGGEDGDEDVDADEKTLRGDGGEEEDWEVLSQDTLR